MLNLSERTVGRGWTFAKRICWRRSPREAAFTFLALVGGGPDGQLSVSYKVVGKLEYDPHADNWSGPFKIQVFDPEGNELFVDRGTFTGTRIGVETLD